MWTPALPSGSDPIYLRLVEALEADVRAGVLTSGERLPPQRELAWRMELGVGTVTRAYAEAERRGLISGQVGRGSFVAAPMAAASAGDGVIDLARNLPPLAPAAARLGEALAALARRPGGMELLGYATAGGRLADRRAGSLWLARTGNFEDADPWRLIVTAGAQQAMAAAIMALTEPGDAVIAEAATFAGIKTLAAQLRLKLVAAPMDREGMTPEGLDEAAARSGARVAYVLPVQNPTGRVMSLARRRAILAVARKRELMLVEDDLYGPFAQGLGLPPLAALAPERVCHVAGLSKAIAPGLRVGYLVPPTEALAERMLEALRAMTFGAPTFGAAIATQWIEDGAAFEIRDAVLRETTVRAALARQVLGGALETPTLTAAPHLWLPMGELEAERLAGRALRAGVRLTPPRAVTLDDAPVEGVRMCLGGAPGLAALERALHIVAEALHTDAAEARDVV